MSKLRKTLRFAHSEPFVYSPISSIEATDLEIHDFVYHAYTQRIKTFLFSPRNPRLETSSRSNEDTFRGGTWTFSISQEEKAPDVSSLSLESTSEFFIALQSWEGYVQDILPDGFIARLTDVKTNQDEDATIPLRMVSDGDRPLLQAGAVFYWSIGYSRDWTDQIQMKSELRFRRLSGVNDSDFEKAKKEAQQLSKSLGITSDRTQFTSTI